MTGRDVQSNRLIAASRRDQIATRPFLRNYVARARRKPPEVPGFLSDLKGCRGVHFT
jgi:hypothetical protein